MPDAAAELVARHYSDRVGQSAQERKRSDILQLRELNNWVRAALRCGALRDEALKRASVCAR